MASTIKVDNVQNQPGTNIVNKCGTTVTVGAASDNIRSAGNNLQASDGGNLISQSGTTVTLGASGDTVTLASGATQTGFGREGSVDWQTTIKTSDFTAVSGEGYFVNSTSGAVIVTLPLSPSVGDIVAASDYANTADTNNITFARNGSNIEGAASDLIINTEGNSTILVYADAAKGWIVVSSGNSSLAYTAPTFVTATGGTPCSGAICGDYKTHSFTGPGTLTVSCAGNDIGSNSVDYLVVAGGGGGSNQPPSPGQGGGGGGFRISPGTASGSYTVSPLGAAPAVAIAVSATDYPIAVGAGGAVDNAGASSSFSTIPSTGGGSGYSPGSNGCGGSGGGDGSSGNTPPVSPPQGQNGGPGNNSGGGGAGGVGGTFTPPKAGGVGGVGSFANIYPPAGTPGPTPARYFSGGGGGGYPVGGPSGAAGGAGGGGSGAEGAVGANAGTVNTGGGGGGGGPGGSGAGGSGVVIIRYKFQ